MSVASLPISVKHYMYILEQMPMIWWVCRHVLSEIDVINDPRRPFIFLGTLGYLRLIGHQFQDTVGLVSCDNCSVDCEALRPCVIVWYQSPVMGHHFQLHEYYLGGISCGWSQLLSFGWWEFSKINKFSCLDLLHQPLREEWERLANHH